MTKNKIQIDSSLAFDENKLTAQKIFIPAKPLEFSKETKAVFMAFCVSKFKSKWGK